MVKLKKGDRQMTIALLLEIGIEVELNPYQVVVLLEYFDDIDVLL
jgi:hypothetical protein